MKKKIIQIDIDKDELKRKLDIKDGEKGDRGDVGPAGPKGKDGKNVTTKIIREVLADTKIDYAEIKNAPDVPHIVRVMTSGMSSKDVSLQDATDVGSTSTNVITGLAAPTFTYTTGKLTSISYSDGTRKSLIYNIDDTLSTITITRAGKPTITKTLVWDTGVLQSINIV